MKGDQNNTKEIEPKWGRVKRILLTHIYSYSKIVTNTLLSNAFLEASAKKIGPTPQIWLLDHYTPQL